MQSVIAAGEHTGLNVRIVGAGIDSTMPGWALPVSLKPGDYAITVSGKDGGGKPVTVLNYIVTIPEQSAPDEPEAAITQTGDPIEQTLTRIAEVEKYIYERKAEADRHVRLAEMDSVKLYFERREDQLKEFIKSLNEELNKERGSADTKLREALNSQEQVLTLKFEIEKLKIGAPPPALAPEVVTKLVDSVVPAAELLLRLGVNWLGQKIGVKE
jgi:hypothetical protein